MEAVATSIREFGFRQPIVVDTEDVIICGHTRYKAALQLGLEKVPVHVAKDLTPEQIKAYRIADNKTAELAEWNYDLLPIELGELQDCNYDLGLLGLRSRRPGEAARSGRPGRTVRSGRSPRAARRSDHAAGRPVDPWRPSSAVR